MRFVSSLILLLWPVVVFAQDAPQPPPLKTTVTVTDKVSTETPANVTVVDSNRLQQSAGTNLDDRLRDVPGFSLFRRASSVVANPTTQGVSLRGIGSSGASRTLVLWDGIPFNDPFGGWVYWTQFVPDEIETIEISRGAATSVFGDRAMSGAIGVFSRQPDKLGFLADYQAGSQNTHDLSLGISHAWSRFAVSAITRGFTTDGYYIVPQNIRGAVDRPANVRFLTTDLHLDFYTGPGSFFFKINTLAEERGNGTYLTHNSTGLGNASLHYVREFAHDSVSLLAYGTEEGFHSSFSTVLNNRNTERITYLQTVPSSGVGGAGLWQHHSSRWNLLAGTDVNRVDGTDTDRLVPTGQRIGGGTQAQNGVFGQADASLGPVRLYGGLRESITRQGSQTNTFLSPSAGAAYGHKSLRLRTSVYRAFRAPTLNELYRNFSVGNTFTQANPALLPESLWGAEAGFDWTAENSGFRFTAYRNSLSGLITNVTLSSSPTQIVRQRANAAAALSRGVESAFHQRLGAFTADLNYLFVDSRYVTGLRVAQIPKHQGSAQIAFLRDGTMASLGLRTFAYQFDDDLNQFRLPGYATVQLVARQRIHGPLSAQLDLENAFSRLYYTAFTPTPTSGQPRLIRVGFTWHSR